MNGSAERWMQAMNRARLDASCSAYETALRWLLAYPGAEVERRLREIIDAKRAALRSEDG